MKKKIYIILLILLPVTLIGADFEDGFIERLYQYLQKYNKEYPDEKIYIQTDKTYYRQNENLWYKAYLLNSTDNKPSTVSDVLYVELKDPKGNVVAKHEHNVLSGVSDGSFYFNENMAGGLYTLIGYTKWMTNRGDEFLFKKEITVQKVITPRLLLKLDFEKRAYGAGDEVVGLLSVSDLRNNKTTGSTIKSEVKLGGKTIQTLDNVTLNGEAKIRFNLPADLDTSDGLLQVLVTEKGVNESVSKSIPIVINKINLSFFPEGGNLVENVKCRVAFEGLNEFGKGADISGTIVDNKDNIVTRFESFHLGMGSFEITPEPGKSYYARIEKPQGAKDKIVLPIAKQSGYVMNLKTKNDKTVIWSVYAPERSNISLVGQVQGQIYYSSNMSLKKGYNDISVSLKDFPIGVSVFTLFDANSRETCERLVYVNPQKGLSIKLKTDKEMYEPQEEVKVTINTVDKDDKPVSANLALSVVDEQLIAMADDKQDNMLSYILFSSELKGKIQEPFFYFDNTQPKANEAIDYLMLTHGWRRFTWQDIGQKNPRTISQLAEKISDVYGYVEDANGNPRQTDVYLIECAGKKRIAKVKTTPQGQFAFHNVDFTGSVMVVTKLPNYLTLFSGKPQMIESPTGSIDLNEDLKTPLFAEIQMQDPALKFTPPVIVEDRMVIEEREMMAMDAMLDRFDDNKALEEVVVVGYGVQRKATLTGAVTVIREEPLMNPGNLNAALQGKIAGVVVNQRDIDANQDAGIRIRGTASLGNGNMAPTIVLNGIVLPDGLGAGNISDLVNLDDIENITVSKSPATVYSSNGTNNGVIYITTKSASFGYKRPKQKYTGTVIPKREFYVSPVFTQETHNPDLENTTVYWNANVVTDKKGKAELSFKNNNISSSFRITAEGIAQSAGLVGSEILKIATQKPFSIDVKTPLFASIGDTVSLPVMIRNNTQKTVPAKVKLSLPQALTPIGNQEQDIEVMPESTQMVYMSFLPTNVKGEHRYSISASTPTESDSITKAVTVRSVYFPQSFSISGRKMEDTQNFRLEDYVEGSFKAEMVCYTNSINELFAGMESILREPYGCFEQTSSSTFPNIMVLQLMNKTGQGDDATRTRALDLLDKGYKRLASYEVKSTGGFEWFGGDPAHTGLSAYGILEFHEMKKVYDGVDNDMTDRARKFILGRRDGKGGFNNNTRGLDSFSDSPKTISDAYIVYALTETNETGMDKEYQYALQEALESKDMYRMALMANAAYNMKDMSSYQRLIKYFVETAEPGKFDKMKMQTSITRTMGQGLTMETVALWTIAMLKPEANLEMKMIDACIEYISSRRSSYGGFGNPQSTILCLQALTYYANAPVSLEKGKLSVSINDKKAELDLTREAEEGKPMSMDITNLISNGDNTIKVQYSDIEKPLPYGINFYWDYKTPLSSKDCPLVVTTKLNDHTIKRNETSRLSITLENKKNEGLPMSIAIIGIPGGMSLQPWQLKELQEKGVYDFYEIIDDNLVVYYRELKPNDRRQINIDLKAEIPGTYTGTASSTYVYYTSEHKYWTKGFSVRITE